MPFIGSANKGLRTKNGDPKMEILLALLHSHTERERERTRYYILHKNIYTYTHKLTNMHICIHMDLFIYAYTYTCMHTYIYTHTYAYTYTYTYTVYAHLTRMHTFLLTLLLLFQHQARPSRRGASVQALPETLDPTRNLRRLPRRAGTSPRRCSCRRARPEGPSRPPEVGSRIFWESSGVLLASSRLLSSR